MVAGYCPPSPRGGYRIDMAMLEGFRPVAEVTADDRARIALGKTGVVPGARYAEYVNDDGEILLTPVVSIPARELIVWENEELRTSLFRGLADAAEGRAGRLDWVTAPDADDE